MKIFGIEGTVAEFKELASHISISVAIISVVIFLLWQGRKHILKLLQYLISSFFKKRELHRTFKCKHCKKKKFSTTHTNISDILSPSGFAVIGFCDYRKAGDFLICSGCREVVGIWRSDNSLDQYKITEQSSWNDLVFKYRVCFSAYTMHRQWIKGINFKGDICLIEQQPTFEMIANKVNLSVLKSHITREENLSNIG